MIKIALCDDDIFDRSRLSSLLTAILDGESVKYSCTQFQNGLELAAALENGAGFDLYFLDILMRGYDGISLGTEIRTYDKKAKIVYITSSPSFALDSYAVKAYDYLLKPINEDVLKRTLRDILDQIIGDDCQTLILKTTIGLQKIPLASLVFVEAMGRTAVYHTVSGRDFKCCCKFSQASEELLGREFFLKPHRSYIVNMNYIAAINHKEILLQTGVTIPIAQGHTREMKERFLDFLMGEKSF